MPTVHIPLQTYIAGSQAYALALVPITKSNSSHMNAQTPATVGYIQMPNANVCQQQLQPPVTLNHTIMNSNVLSTPTLTPITSQPIQTTYLPLSTQQSFITNNTGLNNNSMQQNPHNYSYMNQMQMQQPVVHVTRQNVFPMPYNQNTHDSSIRKYQSRNEMIDANQMVLNNMSQNKNISNLTNKRPVTVNSSNMMNNLNVSSSYQQQIPVNISQPIQRPELNSMAHTVTPIDESQLASSFSNLRITQSNNTGSDVDLTKNTENKIQDEEDKTKDLKIEGKYFYLIYIYEEDIKFR